MTINIILPHFTTFYDILKSISGPFSAPKGVYPGEVSPKITNQNSFCHSNDEIDVEQWSDNESSIKSSPKSSPKQEQEHENIKSETGGQTPPHPPAIKKRKDEKPKFLKPKCNAEELLNVDCHLETKELWDKFNDLGTEMIITKTGR
jgi:endogenous inhibitor of DNA gyrase (YacG/DUF329 family)